MISIDRPEDVVRQAEFHWKMAGSPEGQLAKYVVEELSEALAERMDDSAAGDLKSLRDEIDEAMTAIFEVREKHEIGDDLDSRVEAVAGTKGEWSRFPSDVAGLVLEMAKEIEAKNKEIVERDAEIVRLKEGSEEEPKPVKPKVKLVRPGLRKARPKRGETTLSLFPETKVEIKEVVKGKRGRKAA